MKRLLFVVGICILCVSPLVAQRKGDPTGQQERVMQTFGVYSGEKKLASDFVTRVRWLQSVDLLTSFTDGMKVVRMDLVYEEDQFRYFKLARDNKEELTVRARRDSFAVSHAVKGMRSLPRRSDELVLEPTAYGQYGFLLNRYHVTKGGEQTFRVLVPSEQKIISVTVERRGIDRFQCGEIVVEAVRYKIQLEKKEIVHAWSMKDGKLIGLHVPSKGLCIADEEYEDLHHNIRALALGGS